MPVETAANILWIGWYTSWIVSAFWSAETKKRMRPGVGGLYRLVAMTGCLFLFFPLSAGTPLFGAAKVGAYTQKLWQNPTWAAWGLLALIAGAFAFCWWARLHLGKLWSGFVSLKEGHHVVDTGPYALVRHPIYSGVFFAALMTALLHATPAALLGFVLITLGFSMTARVEERFLREQLGAESYDAYSSRVPMLVPKVW
ncbi:MAG: isoprenylcysteine carboxylmethyltransferase family protein [Proteobacteria bacterium]|nr:isoprenylcysteine carboxylmethyltransferase family protein [Pseudomonadota bacterium]